MRRIPFFLLLSLFTIYYSLFTPSPASAIDANCTPDFPICYTDADRPPDLTCLPRSAVNPCTTAAGQVGSWCCPAGPPTPTPTVAPPCTSPRVCLFTPAVPDCIPQICNDIGIRPNGNYCCISVPSPTPPPASIPSPTPPPPPGATPTSPIIFPTPTDPRTEGFTPLKYIRDITDCPNQAPYIVNPEFHPLRPYPASPCDPLIPRKDPEAPADPDKLYLTFSCANSLNTHGTYTVLDVVPNNLLDPFNKCSADLEDSFGDTYAYRNYYLCDGQVCLVHPVSFHTAVDLTASKFPIIGNTQNAFDEPLKVNQYLNWYLAGTVQSSDQVPLDPDVEEDMTRLTVFSGPVKKLLPQETQQLLWDTLQQNPPVTDQLHNYLTLDPRRLLSTPDDFDKYSPFSSQEDITSESTISFIPSIQPETGFGYIINGCSGRNPALIIDNAEELSDSRLYFPGLRSSNALTELVQSVTPPPPPTPPPALSPKDEELVSQEIDKHQGLDDPTVVIRPDYLKGGLPTRNTEVIPGQLAPDELFIPDPPTCEIVDTRTNPGDSLVGSTIGSTLTYYQVFQYTPKYFVPFAPGCRVENQSCTPSDACCWGNCEGYQEGGCFGPPSTGCNNLNEIACKNSGGLCEWQDEVPGSCPVWPRRELPSDTRISVFMKTPLVERLYDSLVVGPKSLLRRFLPKKPDILPPTVDYITGENDIETTVPGQDTAEYSGSTPDLNSPSVDAGSGGAPADIYFDRIGSLADHFLGGAAYYWNLNFQRMFRPQDLINAYAPPPGTTGINCDQTRPLQPYSCVPRQNYIDVARRWYGLPTQGYPYAEECFNDTVFRANSGGIDPGLALVIWLNESDTSNYQKIGNVSDFGMVFSPHNDWLAQIAAFINHVKFIKSVCASELAIFDPIQVFAARFKSSSCIPYAGANTYANTIKNTWSFISSCSFPFP